MGYTRADIIGMCDGAIKDVKSFYQQAFVNYRGSTMDTQEYYTEIVAEYVLRHIDLFHDIEVISREKSYKSDGRDGSFSNDTTRDEEVTAMKMFRQSQSGCIYTYIGEIIDYQTPLKNRKADDAGKIDLLSYDGGKLHILELKKEDSKETMLRCVLEGYTYMQTADKKKLLSDFSLPADTEVCTNPFVFREKSQWREMNENRPYLKKLIQMWECNPYYIVYKDEVYSVEQN